MDAVKISKELIEFIDNSPCSYFAVRNMAGLLEKFGFKKLECKDNWELKKGDKCYITNNDSSIIAFTIGRNDVEKTGFKIVGSHSDSPGFRIKNNAQMKFENNLKLNTEVYGGAILSTWFDRPLSIAGRVVLKSDNLLNPKIELVKIDRDLLIIPSLAIHMNRDINKGFEFNPQTHTLPLMGLANEEIKEDMLVDLLAKELSVSTDDITDYDLYLYDRNGGKILGLNNEFVSVGRLDNLAMAYISLKALMDTDSGSGVNVMVCTDNEEVGSSSRQGADSPMVENTLERIAIGLGKNREEFFRAIDLSYIISADMAHAVHLNFGEKADPTNRPLLGGGPVIKYAANKAYTSDAVSASIFKGLCDRAEVPCQSFYNRSDMRGGSTIGPITQNHINIKSVDIGNPMLSMHSVRELCAVDDNLYLYKVFLELYK
ncbi:M18 family aminopeptidase [Peptoniphilus mikwangii]|uniref:M18 family aminopeptidase n=1 Tax=Peptoniphilus mikwangii TaxID=1354300 RepID=UPI000409F67B|nr:M18 family aminopeptidase [Peptoniphilus mikwangii]